MTSHRRFQFLLGSLAVLWLLDEIGSTTPGGASEALEFIREINWESYARIKPICGNGLEMKLGVWWEIQKFGELDDNATCTRVTTKDNYLSEYNLEVKDDYNQDLKLEENFVAIRREVWKCQFKDKQGHTREFHRVVNEMMGLKSIRKVEYYNSIVEVNAKQHLSDGSTIHVLEIKYYCAKTERQKDCEHGTCRWIKIVKMILVCQYDGRLALQHSTPTADGNLIPANHSSTSNDNALPLREVKYLGEGIYKYEESHHEINGVDLTVGSSDFKAYGTENNIYGCVKDQVTSFPFSFRMSAYEDISVDIEARVPQVDYFDNYFIPIREEIWMCVEIVDGAVGGKRILRIVNEVITRKSVRSIKVKDTIVFVAHEEDLINKQYIALTDRYRLKEIKYMDMQTHTLLKYTGGVLLTDKYKKLASNNHANKKEINYMLESNQIFRAFTYSTGFDYIIGSSYEGNTVGNPNVTVNCERRNLSEVASSYTAIQLRLKIFSKLDKVHGVVYSSMKIMGRDVYMHISYNKQQLHFCEHTSDQVSYKFWRVRNEIELIKLSREIETYDGVEIVEGSLHDTLKVIETKYLHHEDYSVIKYVGGVNLQREGGEGETSQPITYPKNEYNIFNIYGSYYSYGEAPRVTKGSPYSTVIKQVEVLKAKTTDQKTLKFGEFDVTTSENILPNDISTCELSCDYEISKNFNKSYFTPSEIDHLKFYDDPNLIDVFFKIINQEVWICYTQAGVEFIRIINEVYFNKTNDQGVNILQYKSGKLSYEMSNNEYQLKLKEVTYMLPPLGGQPQYIQYEGTIIMVPNRKVHMEKSWKSGTYPIERYDYDFTRKIYRPERDVNFELRTPHSEQPLYKTTYNALGTITLELGTTWSRRVPQSSIDWSCVRVESDARSAGGALKDITDAQLYTNVKIPGTEGNMSDAAFSDYFESVQIEIWSCSDSSDQLWYRVINNIILKPDLCGNMKEFYYRLGVTIIAGEGENGECLEINEVKYYNAAFSHVVRFDGEITLQMADHTGQQMATRRNPDTHLQAQAIRLKSGTGSVLGRKDNEYLLQGDEVFKTFLSGKGLIIEVGEPYTDQIILRNPKLIYKCRNIDKPTDQEKNLMKPRATIRNVLECKLQDLNRIFTTSSQILLCKADGEDDIYKIENVMHSSKLSSIAAIYYYDGATLRFQTKDTSKLTIRNIRYITKKTPNRNVRFEGFVQYDPQADEFGYSQDYRPREMNWGILDSEVVHAIGSDANNKGNANANANRNSGSTSYVEKDTGLEISNKWTVEIATDKYSKAGCYNGRILQPPGKIAGLKVFGDYDETSDVLMRGIKVIKRMIYNCYTNKEEYFLRVLNMILIDTNIISKIYFNHGVSVTKLSMENMGMDTMTVLSEVKYLKPDSLEIIKYTGRVIIESLISGTILRLFPFPASLKEYPVELNLESEEELAASTKYASLEKMIIHLMTSEQSTKDVSTKIHYTAHPDKAYRKTFVSVIDNMKPFGASLLVGSPYQKELSISVGDSKSVQHNIQNLKPKCVLDKWSNKGKVQLSTSVSLLVDKTQYMLDGNTIYDYFILNDIQVWVCSITCSYTFLRLVTELELRPYASVYAISYFDGVDLKKEKIEGRDKITLRETKYLSADDLQALKYEGEVLLMDTPRKVKIPTHEHVNGLYAKVKTIHRAGSSVQLELLKPEDPSQTTEIHGNARCVLISNNLYHDALPRFSIKDENTHSDITKEWYITDLYRDVNFYDCTSLKGNNKFYRIKAIYVGTRPVARITYPDDGVEVEAGTIPSNHHSSRAKTARITFTYYRSYDNGAKNEVKLDKGANVEIVDGTLSNKMRNSILRGWRHKIHPRLPRY